MEVKKIVLYDVDYEVIGESTFIKIFGKYKDKPIKAIFPYKPYLFARYVDEEK